MKKISLIASIAVMVCASSLSWAEAVTQSSLDKLMTLSGITKEVSHFPELLQLGLNQAQQQAKLQKSPMSDADFTQIRKAMTSAFQPADIVRAISGEVKGSVSEADAKAILAWLESDLGRKITKAEDDASDPAAYQKMAKSVESLMSDEKRVQFAQRLAKALNSTEQMLEVQENLGVAMVVAMSTASNPAQPVKAADIKAKIAPMLEQQRPNLEQGLLRSYVYTYKDIDLASLDKYVAFLEEPSSKRFHESVMKGMSTGLEQAGTKVGTTLAASLAKKHAKKG